MKKYNKKIISLLIFTLISVEIISLFLMGQSLSNKNNSIDEVILKKDNNYSNEMFAILLEQDNGEYIESTSTSWPSKYEYRLNINESICINTKGEILENALVSNGKANEAMLKVKEAAYCYLYFDIRGEAYALFTQDNNTLTFVRSKTPYSVGDLYNDKAVTNVYTGFEEATYTSSTIPWYDNRSNITNVTFADEISPTSTSNWFFGMNLDTFNVVNLDTSNVITATEMFRETTFNTEIDLSRWDVSKLTDLNGMFSHTTLTNSNLSNWNLASATSLEDAFTDAVFTNVDISNWKTSSITNMSGLFGVSKYAPILTNVDVSNWDTSNVTDMSYMLEEVTINSITGLSTWNTSNVTNMSGMINDAEINGDLGIEGWNTSNVTNMEMMITSTRLNVDLNLSGWDVSNVSNKNYFAYNLSGTGTLTEPIWPTT